MYQLFYCCYCISIGAGKRLLISVQRYPADLFAPNIRQARIVQADRFDSRCKGALIIRHPDFLTIHFNRDYSRNRHIHLPPSEEIDLIRFIRLVQRERIFYFQGVLSQLVRTDSFFYICLCRISCRNICREIHTSRIKVHIRSPKFRTELLWHTVHHRQVVIITLHCPD